jgi:hypothetical protein
MEETAKNIDRLVTVGAGWGGRLDRWIVPTLYESASQKLGGKPISLVAAQKLMEQVREGDCVILVDQFGYLPNMPYGETDGPLGVASLARTLRFGLKALPMLVSGPRDLEVAKSTTKAAGLNVLPLAQAMGIKSAVAGEMLFPVADEAESKKAAARILDQCSPKAIIAVEAVGPNKIGIKHSGAGYDVEAEEKLPKLEQLFYEAANKGILTIGVIDRGNELGSGTIEETVRKVAPYANVCRCPCQRGGACAVKTDIIFPASTSNWGAYAITAMMAYLLKRPELLQDEDTEYRMLDACVTAGAVDGIALQTTMGVDSIGIKAQQALICLMHAIIENALKDI